MSPVGDRLEIRGRFVLNAAGPYAERLLTGSLGQGLSPPTPFSRDAYFIVAAAADRGRSRPDRAVLDQ